MIKEYRSKALLVLRDIATDQLESTENRIKAAETILEYTAKQNDDSGENITTEAIGFGVITERSEAGEIYDRVRNFGMNVSEAMKVYST